MDTAGQDEYSIMSSAYDGMDGYILVYDITNRKSFEVFYILFTVYSIVHLSTSWL